jgi:hypothetical protein
VLRVVQSATVLSSRACASPVDDRAGTLAARLVVRCVVRWVVCCLVRFDARVKERGGAVALEAACSDGEGKREREGERRRLSVSHSTILVSRCFGNGRGARVQLKDGVGVRALEVIVAI